MADKAFGMGGVGGREHTCPLELNDLGAAEVDVGRGVEANPRVAVLVVVPAKEVLAEGPAILDRAEVVQGTRGGTSGS